MVTLGNDSTPGVVTDVSTADTVGVTTDAPSDVGIIGQYDPTTGTATPNTVYQVTRGSQARTLFGDGGHLAGAVIDAIMEGANPVYALTPQRNTVSGEDLSGLATTSGTLANAPVSEDASKTTFTIDGVVKTTIITYHDPSTETPAVDEVYLNPTTGAFELDAAPADADATNDTVDYEHFDYSTAVNSFVADIEATDAVDFLAMTTENEAAVSKLVTEVGTMATEYDFAIAIAGAGSHVTPSTYTNPHDTSRAQLVYPSRNDAQKTTIGSYVGRRATLGIGSSPINKRLRTQDSLAERLSKQQQADLINANVVPLLSHRRGTQIVDDPTCVSDTNTAEAAFDYGLSRLVMDAVIETVKENEEPFVGKFNNPDVLKRMENVIDGRLAFLLDSGSILSYSVYVEKVDATTADVEVGVTPVAPLRNIYNTITAGN